MNVRRGFMFAAFFFAVGGPFYGQVPAGGAMLAVNQPMEQNASLSSASDDSLPQNPLPVDSNAVPAAFVSRNRLWNPASESLASLTGEDRRSMPCNCQEESSRPLMLNFTSYGDDGRSNPDVPQVAGVSNAAIGDAYWNRHRLYAPLLGGIKFGHQEISEVFAGNFVGGITSNVKHVLHLGSSR